MCRSLASSIHAPFPPFALLGLYAIGLSPLDPCAPALGGRSYATTLRRQFITAARMNVQHIWPTVCIWHGHLHNA
jgi:hypothetical protein